MHLFIYSLIYALTLAVFLHALMHLFIYALTIFYLLHYAWIVEFLNEFSLLVLVVVVVVVTVIMLNRKHMFCCFLFI